MRVKAVAALAMALATLTVGCSPAPSHDPRQTIRVLNNTNRAIAVSLGSLLNGSHDSAVRPCGGELTLAVAPADYTDDGRLMAFLARDESGSLDVALKAYRGDPADVPGNFNVALFWSRGDLAGRLPVVLTVGPDFTVTEGATPGSSPSVPACTPAF